MEHALLGLKDFFIGHGGLSQLSLFAFLSEVLTLGLNLSHKLRLFQVKQLIKNTWEGESYDRRRGWKWR